MDEVGGGRYEGAVSTPAPKVVVFLHHGEYDRVHQGLSIAAAAVASGRRAEVYLFWWALERFLQGRLDEPDFTPPREDVADRFETRRIPTLRQLLEHLRESGLCTVQGCTGSLGALGAESLADKGPIDGWVGWSAILQRTAGVVDRFYL
jgi:peroxiredoxin family protein